MSGWRGAPVALPAGFPVTGRMAATVLMALRRPPERVLTAALRELGRRRPEVFERLGAANDAALVVAPTDFPVAFRLRPGHGAGEVEVVRHDDGRPAAARISGPLATLIGLFDGACDADSAFFARRIRITGDTRAVVALHNTLEAAELTTADLLPLPGLLRRPAAAVLEAGLARLRAREA